MPAILAKLSPDEALTVLRRLLETRPELRAEAERIALSHLDKTSFERVAAAVVTAVRGIDVRDVRGRAGRQEWGYYEPGEAASEVLLEAIEPFLADLRRHLKMGVDEAALETCKGVLLGLYRLRDTEGSEVLDLAPDFAGETATVVFQTWASHGRCQIGWRSGGRYQSLPVDFVERHVPEWADMLRLPASLRRGARQR